MKFLDFVSCCGPTATSRHSVRPEPPARRPDETTALVEQQPPSRSRRRRKRGRLGVSGSASAEWKPSLCSISEDNVVIDKGEENRTAGSERLIKRKSGPRSSRTLNNGGSSFIEDYGRSSFPIVIPAFSPTPFMF